MGIGKQLMRNNTLKYKTKVIIGKVDMFGLWGKELHPTEEHEGLKGEIIGKDVEELGEPPFNIYTIKLDDNKGTYEFVDWEIKYYLDKVFWFLPWWRRYPDMEAIELEKQNETVN